jgi:hypothetical protein
MTGMEELEGNSEVDLHSASILKGQNSCFLVYEKEGKNRWQLQMVVHTLKYGGCTVCVWCIRRWKGGW